ncbi:hypothetical protein Stube_36630 [Streptomyces tubercidicus]|uniref:Uncharacterized protein n=1 Tax=Streptomyces tubercidicus TaxID=47759 RepID=A0A640UU94_9ACTN|nr:hypothetical protein Stube_36630 [Streptomyces tubercidicus]
MDGIGDDGFDGEDLDPDAVQWVRGVDYLAGWRDATQAAAQLGDALTAAGVDTTETKLRAIAASDGSGGRAPGAIGSGSPRRCYAGPCDDRPMARGRLRATCCCVLQLACFCATVGH